MRHFFLTLSDIYPNSFLGFPRWMCPLSLNVDLEDILCAPRNFRVGESYFGYVSSRHQLRRQDYIYIHTDKVETLYLCALLNSSLYRTKLFGERIRPYSIHHLGVDTLLGIPFLKPDKDIQNELCHIESIILSLRYDKNIPIEHQRILDYVIRVFEQVRNAYILEMDKQWLFSIYNIQIRKSWLRMIRRICTENLEDDTFPLFEELCKPTNEVMNNIKRMKLYI